MNFPVLFRTRSDQSDHDRNAIRHGVTLVTGLVWQVSPSTFLFLHEGMNLLVCAHVLLPFGLHSAGAPDDRRRPLACMEASFEVTMRSARWARSSVG